MAPRTTETELPGQPAARAGRGIWRDALAAAAVFCLCLLGGIFHADDSVGAPGWPAYLLAAIGSALTPARRRYPLPALAAATLCAVLATPLGILPTPLAIAPIVLIAYSMTSHSDRRSAWVAIVASVLLVLSPMAFSGDPISWEDTSRWGTILLAPLVAGVLGRSTRHRRAYLDFMEERARRAEESRDAQAAQKVAQERLRIARELHDLVAHQITLANAQAAVAERLFDSQPEKARENLRSLQHTTRSALDELRSAVGLLRADDIETPEPAPGLRQLPQLAGAFHNIGLAVELRSQGTARELPQSVDLTAYRIIQEALTNVSKHSMARTADVDLAWDDQQLSITVSDPGPPREQQRAPGYGLLGMGERAIAVGGEFNAEPGSTGGFTVKARLPLQRTRESGK